MLTVISNINYNVFYFLLFKLPSNIDYFFTFLGIDSQPCLHVKLRRAVLSDILNLRESDKKSMSDSTFLPKRRVYSMATQLTARGPNPDLLNAEAGLH